ncbi:uncharacterized protein LOC114124033 [Aphis gossypii]|uniref:Uncharacterized protein n=1 Tax=Aphis gossypii TaxID=80765 RepID=A0A9P0J2S9_APHGO|nr:uncharacterized protein LOC114124033 [Aphis gossypii]CAH1725631.1 unnamed protein product [Aphis gossypii]
MPLPSSPSDDLSQSPSKNHSDEQQETIHTENQENNNSSNDGRDGLSLDMWRTCPVSLIRSNPSMRVVYDRGFLNGFYRDNLKQSAMDSSPTESTKTAENVLPGGAKFESSSETGGVTDFAIHLAVDSAFYNAIETALDSAVEVAEISKLGAFQAQAISQYRRS